MLISKERAEYIAEISYELFENDNSQGLITYQRATELDNNTADKITTQIETKLKNIEMKVLVNSFGGKVYYADDEIIEVDNLQYIDSIKYDVLTSGTKKEIMSISCKMYEGESFTIPSGTPFYGPNIYYGGLFNLGSDGIPLFKELTRVELYLKMLIVEDRLVNPYSIFKINNNYNKIVVGMKEAIDNFRGYDKEIDLINKLLKICDGKIISSGIMGGFADISIKATVLYLESIEENILANEVRRYQNNELRLNLVLDRAFNGYSGLTFSGRNTKVTLL